MGKKKEEKIILEGVFTKIPPMTYPGRIYGMYVWDWDISVMSIQKMNGKSLRK